MTGPCRRWRPAPASDEGRARERVIASLVARHPDQERCWIEDRVDAAWESLSAASLRDFVPILVTREVGEQLRQR